MKAMKKQPKFKLNTMTCLIAVTAIVSIAMLVKGFMYQPAIAANKERTAQINESIEYETRRIEEIDAMMEKVGTDEYVEKIAREKLGMVKSDEIVFVDISGQ